VPQRSRSKRLLKGQFDTPPEVADLGFSAAVRSTSDRVWEPTCGDGSFLDAALRAGHPADRLLGTEIDPARLDAARARLPQGVDLRLADLFTLTPADIGPFDVIVGNPPFVRPERMAPDDRRRIRAAVAATGFEPPAKADLAVLALLHCLPFLAPGGRLSFVMPNSWMDADFGVPVRRFLRRNHRVLRLIESRDDPWFPEVSLNTVIVVLQRTDERGPTEFVQLHREGRRIHRADPGDGRWTVPLRAPKSWRTVLRLAGDRLVPMGDALHMGYGTKVGIAPFFTPRPAPEAVEPRWRRPFLRTLRGTHRYEVRPEDVAGVLFDFSADPEAAADPARSPGSAAWIAEGARRHNRGGIPFPAVPSVRHHTPWYAMREVRTGPILIPQFRSERHYILANPSLVPVNNSAWWGRWKADVHPDLGGGLLNCTWMALAAEVLGRTNLGEGLLTLYGPDLKALPVPDPTRFTEPDRIISAFQALRRRPVLPLGAELDAPDRRALDAAVAIGLGVDPMTMEIVRADALRLVRERLHSATRLRQARRVPPGA
jgi:predicted RNA methylase